jgi:hypothetical protein
MWMILISHVRRRIHPVGEGAWDLKKLQVGEGLL